jgi:hypothetical protein
MIHSRTARIAVTLSATLTLALLAVVTGASHEQDEPVARGNDHGPGPRRTDPVEMPRRLVGLEIDLGIGEVGRASYNGDVSVSEGRVVGLDVIRSGPNARVEGNRFEVATPKKVAKKKKKQQNAPRGPALHANLDVPERATVTVHTGHGQFSFHLADAAPGKRLAFLDGEAAVFRQAAAVRLTGAGTEDDFPAAARAADGTAWVAYVEYHPEVPHLAVPPTRDGFDSLVPTRNGDVIRLRHFDGTIWRPAVDVTEGGLDVWRPAVSVDGQGKVWVAWAEQIQGDWEIRARAYSPAAEPRWGNPVRISNTKGSDFHVVAATDAKGVVWLAWQAFRDGNYDILATPLIDGKPLGEPKVVSVSKADDWSPAIAADGRGRVFVAWDTYDQGNFDVYLREVSSDAAPVAVATTAKFEARPSVAIGPAGRVWVAYEEGDEQWGKDFASVENFRKSGYARNAGNALYVKRTVKLKCLNQGRLEELAAGAEPPFGELADRNKSHPRLAIGGDGSLWLLVRHHPLPGGGGEQWVTSAARFDGRGWSNWRRPPDTSNLMDNRPAVFAEARGVVVVVSTDHRQNTAARGEADLYAFRLLPFADAPPVEPRVVPTKAGGAATLFPAHPSERADIARVRSYRVEVGGKTLRPLRGEFHRHTEVSSHRDQDGSLEDSWRYALDAANHDWMGNADHDNGYGHEYLWWLIQKSADLHHNPPRFVGAQTYERSLVYPNGHRNVMMPRRGIRPLPRGIIAGTEQAGTPDTKVLYAYLKHFGGICASHTSATDMGTDWRDNDPEVEPVVEIYQGHRHNYEHFGAPRSPTEATQIGGYEPKGFIWNALEKGYRLGFESSSDHVSTHLSYAIVYAEDTSRQAIIDAFKKRHCYAATDNILLDVRSSSQFMGDAFVASGKPSLDIVVKGTAPVAKVHVIRDNAYVFSTEPKAREVKLRYTDDDAKAGTHYYYVRVEQADGNLAWGSPMWITVK